MQDLTLFKVGEIIQISGYRTQGTAIQSQLLALGMTLGTKVKILSKAPCNGPYRLLLRGVSVVLRKTEARLILVKKIHNVGVKTS